MTAALLLSACSVEPPVAEAAAQEKVGKVEHLIVRYELGAPPATEAGRPWGSQCVVDRYADRLERGQWLGARMRLIRIYPPVAPLVGRRIAVQLGQCPYVDWAEADDTRLSVPNDDLISG